MRSVSRSRFLAAASIAACALLSPGCTFVKARMEMKRGNQAYNTNHFEDAVDAYQKVIEIDPAYRDAYFNLGLAYLSLYQPGSMHEKDIAYSRGAIKAFKDYLAIDPENEKVKGFLIETCQKSGNNEEAIAFFEQEHAKHPDDIKTIALLGNLYGKIGDIDKALEWFEKRVQLEPDNPEAYYTIGVNCWGRSYNHMDLSTEDRFRILDRGLAALERATALKQGYFEALTYKNLIYRQKAAFDPDPNQRAAYNAEADKYLKEALDIQNRLRKEAAAASPAPEAKAGGA